MPSASRHLLLAVCLSSGSASLQLGAFRVAVAPTDLARGPPLPPAVAAAAGATLREHGFVILSAETSGGANGEDPAGQPSSGVVGRDGECAQCAYEAFVHLKGLLATATALSQQPNHAPEVTVGATCTCMRVQRCVFAPFFFT
jgi:hypothetical protein